MHIYRRIRQAWQAAHTGSQTAAICTPVSGCNATVTRALIECDREVPCALAAVAARCLSGPPGKPLRLAQAHGPSHEARDAGTDPLPARELGRDGPVAGSL